MYAFISRTRCRGEYSLRAGDRETGRQTERQADNETLTGRAIDSFTNVDRNTERLLGRETDRETVRQQCHTDSDINSETGRQTDIWKETQIDTL